ncbi:leucyl aminopeptidase [Demequina sp. NBRC 110054]|uniref:M17 family metallopeptidase n=1 Tax=Demequina sp. NBRC 110054 TaxID=1570343 RepID=UPI0009FFD362|nr:leucyl aminopeptidase [Demequina sp. NBRC 110054]
MAPSEDVRDTENAPLSSLEKLPTASPGALAEGPVAFLVTTEEPAGASGLDAATLEAMGFTGEAGSTAVVPNGDRPLILSGMGANEDLSLDGVRDAAAVAARVLAKQSGMLTIAVGSPDFHPAAAATAVVEGAALGRYRYTPLKSETKCLPLESLGVFIDGASMEDLEDGIAAAMPTIRAAVVARDLANTPAGILTATRMGEVAEELGHRFGFSVDSLGPTELEEMGCGGLLGVNAGSTEEPRLIVLTYNPEGEVIGHLGMVGKGIMYDSGGISLKPSDPMHLLMKIDMGGAAAVLGAFTALQDLGAKAKVSAWLMCTDNMPSGSATKLGDVLVARNGKTVEVKNTDAEGRLVLMDGLSLAVEAEVDAVIDIATLTGSALMALGKSRAAFFSNDDDIAAQVEAAAFDVDEPVWRMPLEKKYRKLLNSKIADIANIGGPYAGATTAALFLQEFVSDIPWAHVDIAGTMQTEEDDAWRPAGATGYGARLLATVAAGFSAVPSDDESDAVEAEAEVAVEEAAGAEPIAAAEPGTEAPVDEPVESEDLGDSAPVADEPAVAEEAAWTGDDTAWSDDAPDWADGTPADGTPAADDPESPAEPGMSPAGWTGPESDEVADASEDEAPTEAAPGPDWSPVTRPEDEDDSER